MTVDADILFEVVPPNRVATDDHKRKIMETISSALSSADSVELINVPEIVEENRKGEPHYRNEPSCCFARQLREKTGKQVIVNKAVVHCKDRDDFVRWLKHATGSDGIQNFIFTGGNSGLHQYPGPTVTDATRLALQDKTIAIGNILIPSRSDESERLIRKTVAGASFFTTQVLFSSEPLKTVLSSYKAKCAERGLKPGKVFLSFTPVRTVDDLDFLKWLGADISPDQEKRLLHIPATSKSIELAAEIWADVSKNVQESELGIGLGVNIEEIFIHNLEPALQMVQKLAGMIEKVLPSKS